MADSTILQVLDRLTSCEGMDEAEVFLKRGRSRRTEVAGAGLRVSETRERGWAARASSRRASFFVCGTGTPRVEEPWPEPDGHPLRLPPPSRLEGWRPPVDLDSPLMVESEVREFFDVFRRELTQERSSVRLSRGVLEEGTSDAEIVSTRGVDEGTRGRSASLLLELVDEAGQGGMVRFHLAQREARAFNPAALARRAVDRLLLQRGTGLARRDRGEVLVSPAVAVALVEGLLPVLVGEGAERRVRRFRDRSGQVAAKSLSIIDDGRLPGGVLSAPVDGEGVATRETILVEEGCFRQPLLAWWQAPTSGHAGSGCSHRHSWRDLPVPGPTHLFIKPAKENSVGALLTAVARGFYLLEPTSGGRFDLEADRFNLPVCGFAVREGRATSPIAEAWLSGTVSALLRGVQAVARDLTFYPRRGMIGSPSLLLTGIEVRPEPRST